MSVGDGAASRPARALEPQRLRRGLTIVILVGAAAGAAVALFSGGPAMIGAARDLPVEVLAWALLLNLVSWLGEAAVFLALSGRRGPRAFLRMIGVYVGGGFPGLVTPFGTGAIPGWVYALTREGLSAGEATAVVGARGLLTSMFFVAVALGGAALAPAVFGASAGVAWGGLAGLVLVLAVATLVVMRPGLVVRLAGRLLRGRALVRVAGAKRAEALDRASDAAVAHAERFASALRSLVLGRPGALLIAILGLVFSRVCLLAILPVLMSGLGWSGDVVSTVLMVVGVWALASGSPTPGGSGAVEAGLTAVLSTQAPVSIAGAAALLWRGSTFYVDLFVGWFFFAGYMTDRPGGHPRRR